MNLFVESCIVGLVTGIIGLIVSTLFMIIFTPGFSFKKYDFWFQVFVSYFITGMVIHLIFEATGLNSKFCCQKDRYKC